MRDWGSIKAPQKKLSVYISLFWFYWGHHAHFNEDKEFWQCRSKFSVPKALQEYDFKVACLTDANAIHCFPVVHSNKGNVENRWRTNISVIQMCAVIISLYLHEEKLQTYKIIMHFIINAHVPHKNWNNCSVCCSEFRFEYDDSS